MADFTPYEGGWINLDHVVEVWPDEPGTVLLEIAGGERVNFGGEDARALLARLQDKPDDAREYPRDAQKQAQELAATLGKGTGRRFSFSGSQGLVEGTVEKTYSGWIARVGDVAVQADSEARALEKLMKEVG